MTSVHPALPLSIVSVGIARHHHAVGKPHDEGRVVLAPVGVNEQP